jgi:hypothetical protein
MTLALRELTASGDADGRGRGEDGISSDNRMHVWRGRRAATRAPPPLTFKAVVRSRNSLPLPSLPRKKSGIASGNLCHCRRSWAIRHPPPGPTPHQHTDRQSWKLRTRFSIGIYLTDKQKLRCLAIQEGLVYNQLQGADLCKKFHICCMFLVSQPVEDGVFRPPPFSLMS